MISILDYDMANLRSVAKAIEASGHAARVIRTAEEIRASDKVILPGVGAFADAARILKERELAPALHDHVKAGKPLMGICLGLQLLFETGYEDGVHEGLGVLAGDCIRFTVDSDPAHRLKIPHMGWNTLQFHTPSPLFKNVAAESHVYFVHSYYVRPKDAGITAATTTYGHPFTCSVVKDNVMAVQFHPEKSQAVGLQILKNFAEF